MTTWDQRTLLEDVPAHGVDDWVYAGWVYHISLRSGLREPSQLRALSLGLIAELLTRGLMVAGEYDGDAYRPWDCPAGEAIERITRAWIEWGESQPTPGAIVWLDVTESGQKIGSEVLAREAASNP